MNEVPPPFRAHTVPPFLGMDDDHVIAIAANALQCAAVLPIGSPARAAQWSRFDAAMGELSSRAVRHALRKVHEIHERERGDVKP